MDGVRYGPMVMDGGMDGYNVHWAPGHTATTNRVPLQLVHQSPHAHTLPDELLALARASGPSSVRSAQWAVGLVGPWRLRTAGIVQLNRAPRQWVLTPHDTRLFGTHLADRIAPARTPRRNRMPTVRPPVVPVPLALVIYARPIGPHPILCSVCSQLVGFNSSGASTPSRNPSSTGPLRAHTCALGTSVPARGGIRQPTPERVSSRTFTSWIQPLDVLITLCTCLRTVDAVRLNRTPLHRVLLDRAQAHWGPMGWVSIR